MGKAPCSIRGLINDLTRTITSCMVHLDDLLLKIDNDSEEFGEAWLADQQLGRALEFFFELRFKFIACHQFGDNIQCEVKCHNLIHINKIFHQYNNLFTYILGYFELIQDNYIKIGGIHLNTKQIHKIIQDINVYKNALNHPSKYKQLKNKSNICYKDNKLINANQYKLSNYNKILLVEDDINVNKILAKFLRKHKFFVIECSDGETALGKFDRSRDTFSIFIIDIELPDINGPDLVKYLLQKNPNINVLYISGYPEITLKQKYPSINQYQIMIKPFQLIDLLNRIRSITIN